MEYQNRINPLLEAMAYLGRKAAGNTWEQMEEKIRKKGIDPSPDFLSTMQQLKAVTAQLDGIPEDPEVLALFLNLDGFTRNTIGSASRAFFLLYGFLESYDGDFAQLVRRSQAMTPAQRAHHIALALDMAEECDPERTDPGDFMRMVLSLAIPDTGKVAIMETYQNFPGLMVQLQGVMTPLLSAIEHQQTQLQQLCDLLFEKLEALGCEAYLAGTSSFTPADNVRYTLRPFVFGLDTDLTTDREAGQVSMYCGILRQELLTMLSSLRSSRDSVFDAFRLLGDKTRFELVCYLSHRSAYGQELSQRFDLSRNTIHHHMSKLSQCGLVRCTADGNRVYYTLNRPRIRALLAFQEELLGIKDQPDTEA